MGKYQEVALLLFKKKGGVLTGHMWKNVDYDNCMAAAKKVFEHMSAQRNSRDWYENVFCAGCPQLIDNDSALPLAKPYVRMFESLRPNHETPAHGGRRPVLRPPP